MDKIKTNFSVFDLNRNTSLCEIEKIIPKLDIIFHFAGVNKSAIKSEFYASNVELTKKCEIAE